MKKTFKILGVILATFFALLILIPYLIPQTLTTEITKAVNKNIKGEVRFENTNISFFNHFPSLTLNLNEFLLKGSAPFQQDTLLYAHRIALGINIFSLLSANIKVDKFYLDEAKINILTDEKGHANYNVFQSTAEKGTDTTTTAIKIDRIFIRNSNLTYADRSIPMVIKARTLNYTGEGNLSNSIFDLKSKITIDEMDVFYAGTPYLLNKKLNANLLTKVNTNSLDLSFDENDLKINSLPIRFIGRFSFIKDGYVLDFRTNAKETDLENIFSAMPPAVATQFKNTKIAGYAEINASLIGKYVASAHIMPTLSFNLKVRDGSISNPKTPEPLRNLYINLKTKLPSLNPDSLSFNLDSLYFTIGKDYLASVTRFNGLTIPNIYTKTRSDIDLEKWMKVLNMDGLKLRGRLAMRLQADGKYTTKIVHSGIRKTDTVIATIPKFAAQLELKNGYFQHPDMPVPIHKINFKLNAENKDSQIKNTTVLIQDIDIAALDNFISGFAKIDRNAKSPVDVLLKADVDFADIKKLYPLKGIELAGKMNINLQTKGIYSKQRKRFPTTRAIVKLTSGRIKTSSFVHALENIEIDANLLNTDGTLKNTKMNISPVSFSMGGQAFSLRAKVNNFENVAYDIRSKGAVNIGSIYKLFAIKGYQVKGIVTTNLSLKGLQSDAMAGKYANLKNSGSMNVKSLNLQSDLFPKDFLIKDGRFSFFQDKMKFDRFLASYGQSDFNLSGNLSNVINYVLDEKSSLQGDFNLRSNNINVDEFMVYANTSPSNASVSAGVIIIPTNLNINFSADAKQIRYNGLTVKEAKGKMQINNGSLNITETGFELAGAQLSMDAMYKNTGTKSGLFDFRIVAKNFDIARAYKEIKLFREMATSASKVKGVVGLDYQLSGKLNANMFPVLPSVTGGGTLTLKTVSLFGFKMMNAVSTETKRDSLTNPKLKDVQIKSTIKNNILTIEQTKMRIAGFRPRFEGQVSLDGKLNLSGRLGLPPFGIFGIPLSVTGTQENPIVKLKKNKDGKLEETEEPEK